MSSEKKPKILIVNYDKECLHRFESLLAGGGFQVDKTLWGEAAIVMAKETFYDLIYCCLNMPGMNGLEVSKKILESSPRTKMVLFVVNPEHGENAEIMFWEPESRTRIFKECCPVIELSAYTQKILRDEL